MKKPGGSRQTIDLKNKKFGDLTVLRQLKGNGSCAIWECECSCGNLHNVRSPLLRRGEIKSCGSCKEHYNWKGHENLSGHYFAIIKTRAKKRNHKFDLTIKWLWDLFVKQDKKCALSGMDLHLARTYSGPKKTEQTASLDRIDSNQGYIKGNVQWVHKDINRIKREYSQDLFLKYVKLIAENLEL